MTLDSSQFEFEDERHVAVVTIGPESTIAAAAEKMRARGIGCLVVSDDDGAVVGVVSERDIVNRVVAGGIDPRTTRVAEVMTTDVASCGPKTSIEEARQIMVDRKIRHLPVLDGGRAVAMLSSLRIMDRQLATIQAAREAAEQVAIMAKSFGGRDMEDLLDSITRRVGEVFGAGKVTLCLPGDQADGSGDLLTCRQGCTCSLSIFRDREAVREALAEGNVVCSRDKSADGEETGPPNGLVIPVDLIEFGDDSAGPNEGIRGCLCLCELDAAVSGSAEAVLYKASLVREALAGTLSYAKAYHRDKQNFMTDPLTGAGTRRLFEEQLQIECERALRYKRPFCLAVIDVDNLKSINDELGHAAGDETLRQVAACISGEKRGTDALARYGGDEFVLLMPEVALEGASLLLERIRTRVEQIPLPHGFTVTVSCGVAQQEVDDQQSGKEIFHRADQALYEAKRGGRDCIRNWRDVSGRLGYDSIVEQETIGDLQQQIADLSARSESVFVESVWGLVHAIEARDPYTKSHSENVARYAVGIAETMGLCADEIGVMRRAALIQDIGMIGVPDAILRKPGTLTDEEHSIMAQHPRIGVHILQQMRFLERETPIVRHHHERWDGKGYPSGISGAAIPIGARVLAAADALDSITAGRSHRCPRGLAEAIDIFRQGAGSQFDPEVVEALMRWIGQIARQQCKTVEEVTATELLASRKSCVLVG